MLSHPLLPLHACPVSPLSQCFEPKYWLSFILPLCELLFSFWFLVSVSGLICIAPFPFPLHLSLLLFLFLSYPFSLALLVSAQYSLSSMNKHPFHIVSPSPWPFLSSCATLGLVSSFLFKLKFRDFDVFFVVLTLLVLLFLAALWWADIIRESTFQGLHTIRVQSLLRSGMFLLIVSEIFFFLGFFWAYLHCGLSPNIELGSSWPPLGVQPLCPFSVPLLNTLLLLTSGATVTWSHHCLISSDLFTCFTSLSLTILLGVGFTLLQGYEYLECSFTIADSAYGSCFFLATGFHGLHVLLGTLLLLVMLVRVSSLHFTFSRHLGFVFACWYWHFVDVVWILLYLIIYI